MARLALHTEHSPLKIAKADLSGDILYACQCGLSAKFPLCDGSHKRTLDEEPGALYRYSRDGQGALVRLRLPPDAAAADPATRPPAPDPVTA